MTEFDRVSLLVENVSNNLTLETDFPYYRIYKGGYEYGQIIAVFSTLEDVEGWVLSLSQLG